MRHGMRWSGAAAAVLLAAVTAFGQEAKPAFAHTFTLGATLTEGNSDTRQGNATWLTEGEKEALGSVRLGAEGKYGESRAPDGEMDKTIENVKVFANVKKTLSAMSFTYLDATYFYDDIADIDYRVNVGPGLGVYLVKNDATQVSLETGPSYVWERVAGENDEYLALRVQERGEHKIGANARVWESVEYLPSTEDFQDYLLNAEAGIEAAINATLSLRLVVQYKYDNEPAEGTERGDTTFIAGVSVKL